MLIQKPLDVSPVATGTAPLIVSSTTLVTNLNADKVDGNDGSYFLDLANATGVLGETKGGTNQSAWAKGDLLYGLNTNSLSQLGIGAEGQTLICKAGLPAWASLGMSRSSDLTMAASTSVSLGFSFTYAIGEKWTIYYALMAQTTGGTAGLNFKLNTLPTSLTGRMVVWGYTSTSTTLSAPVSNTALTTGAGALMTASFTSFIQIWLTVQGGTASGSIDLMLQTGASQAGTIYKESFARLQKVA